MTSHVDVLCLDKTGTLTANRLSFDAVHPLAATDDDLRRRLGAAVASGSAGNKTSEAIAAGLGATAVKVSARFVPVSPSGTGSTLMRSRWPRSPTRRAMPPRSSR